MLRLVIVLAVLALGACATTAPPQPVADVQPVAPDARVLRYSDPGVDIITLHATTCGDGIRTLHMVRPEVSTYRAEILFRGQLYAGCWATDGASVYLMWEDGDRGFMPLESFVPAASGRSAPRRGRLDA